MYQSFFYSSVRSSPINEKSKFGILLMYSVLTNSKVSGISHTVCVFSLSSGCTMKLILLKWEWSLNSRYAVCRARLKGDTKTVFTSGNIVAKRALSLHYWIPRSDNGQSSKDVSFIIDTYLAGVSLPRAISSPVFSQIKLNVELAWRMIMNLDLCSFWSLERLCWSILSLGFNM